jgi:hypothetical protein
MHKSHGARSNTLTKHSSTFPLTIVQKIIPISTGKVKIKNATGKGPAVTGWRPDFDGGESVRNYLRSDGLHRLDPVTVYRSLRIQAAPEAGAAAKAGRREASRFVTPSSA